MAQETLLENQIEAGHKLLEILDKKYKITNMMWFYYSDVKKWKLLLHSKEFQNESPIHLYSEISQIFRLNENEIKDLSFDDVKLVFKEDALLKLFQSIFHIQGNAQVRLISNYFNGVYIEDALIYRNITDSQN